MIIITMNKIHSDLRYAQLILLNGIKIWLSSVKYNSSKKRQKKDNGMMKRWVGDGSGWEGWWGAAVAVHGSLQTSKVGCNFSTPDNNCWKIDDCVLFIPKVLLSHGIIHRVQKNNCDSRFSIHNCYIDSFNRCVWFFFHPEASLFWNIFELNKTHTYQID